MANSKRGLASADKATRQRVARDGGMAAQRSGNAHDISREASKGGHAAQASGNAHRLTRQERAAGGRNSHEDNR